MKIVVLNRSPHPDGATSAMVNAFAAGAREAGHTVAGVNTVNKLNSSFDSTAEVGMFDFEKKTVLLNSGYEMPFVGLGTCSLSDEECCNSVIALLKAGGRLVDTAYMYGNEAAVGRAVRDSDVPREEIFVITKIYPGKQFAHPEKAIQEALDKLDIGYIDMMLLHHPGKNDVQAYGVTSAQVILRWNLQKDVVVIPGSGNPEHIQEDLDLFGFELTDAEMEQIKALNRNEKHDWY